MRSRHPVEPFNTPRDIAVVPGGLDQQAVLFDHGQSSMLAYVAGATSTYAAGINNALHVAGAANFGDIRHAVLWKGGVAKDLGTLFKLSDENSWGVAINSTDVVLVVDNDGYLTHTYLWDKGKRTELPRSDEMKYIQGNALNDAGHVAGITTDNVYTEPFIYRDGQVSYLTCSCSNAMASGINNVDVTIGNGVFYPYGTTQGIVWAADGTPTPLGTLPNGDTSWARAINDAGTIVGFSYVDYDQATHAFIYRNGAMKDLNAMLDAQSVGWELVDAMAIDNKGAIAGFGYFQGAWTAYLATPAK